MIRKLHLYLGTLFAPAILFFSFTGILQTIGLHEADDPAAARPAAWIVAIASLHKEQHLPQPKAHKADGPVADMRAGNVEQDRRAAASTAPAGDEQKAESKQNLSQTLLKAFVVSMAIGLIASALLGIYIALGNPRTRRTAILMLAVGTILPIVLVLA